MLVDQEVLSGWHKQINTLTLEARSSPLECLSIVVVIFSLTCCSCSSSSQETVSIFVVPIVVVVVIHKYVYCTSPLGFNDHRSGSMEGWYSSSPWRSSDLYNLGGCGLLLLG